MRLPAGADNPVGSGMSALRAFHAAVRLDFRPVEQPPVRIAMWSGPRNISTTLLRSWGARPDTFVCDEPLYAHYLLVTGAPHPGREEVIARQQRDVLELSTPVVQLWDGVLALPLIGTLDSERTQVVMENLLQHIVETGAQIAIIDITGVPTVDTLVAQHLLKTVAAARLMGADCIISGIRPQIAQTIVHLGVELGQVTTKATLASAFAIALRRSGLEVTRMAQPASGGRPAV